MFFRQRSAENATLSYFFGCAGYGKALAVDVVAGDDKPSSTLAFEKRWNASLSLDKAAFVDQVVREIPPRPEGMNALLRANSGLDGRTSAT